MKSFRNTTIKAKDIPQFALISSHLKAFGKLIIYNMLLSSFLWFCCCLSGVLFLLSALNFICISRMTLRFKKLLYGFIPIEREYQLVEMCHVRE